MSSFTPTRRIVHALGMTLWGLTRLGWEMVVWGNVRAGSINVSNTPRSFRLLIRLALWLCIGLLAMLLFGEAWRRVSPLTPMVFYTDSLAGLYLPGYFVPVALGLLVLAWAYLLCGALHAPWWAALLVLILFSIFEFGLNLILFTAAFTEVSLIMDGFETGVWALGALALHFVFWPTLLLVVVVRRFRPLRLGLEFPVCLVIVGGLLFSSYYGTRWSLSAFQNDAAGGAVQLTETLATMSTLLTPFLLISGAEVANFGMSLTHSLSQQLRRVTAPPGRWLWIVGLAAFLLYRLMAQWLMPLFTGDELPFRWGAVVIGLLLLGLFFLLRRSAPLGALPEWVIPGMALILYVLILAITVIAYVSGVLAIGAIALGQDSQIIERATSLIFGVISEYNEFFVCALVLTVSLGLWVHARLQRRPLPAASVFGLIFSVWVMWWIITRADRALGGLTFKHDHLLAFSTLVLLALLIVSMALRRLDTRALLHLTAAALLLWLLEFQNLLSDPLSPLFALLGAQAALLSVSIFLNVMGAGGRFGLNLEGSAFHRYARSLLYFGYALLAITTINWLAVSHDAAGMSTNDLITQNGFTAIGMPLVFWALLGESAMVVGEAPSSSK
jgi:hypothetical protein